MSPYGQLSFYTGAPSSLRPVNQRVKTLLEDYLPVIRFGFDRDRLRYDVEAFAAPVDMDARGDLVTFVAFTVRNPGLEARAGALGANYGDIASDINVDPAYDWFKGQRQALKDALRTQRSDWHSRLFIDEAQFATSKRDVSFEGGKMVQAGHLVFTGPKDAATPGLPGLNSAFKEAAVEYDFRLRPGETRVFRFAMPAVPVALVKSSLVSQIAGANHDDYRAKTIAFWKAELAGADRFSVADPKVMNTLRTSLVNDLVAREVGEDGRVYQRVNRIHYNYFWIRDGSYFVRMYDMLGLHALARETLDAFLVWDNGRPVSFFKPGAPQPPGARLSVQDDYWGQVLWAVGAHIRTTGDRALLDEVYPLLGPHIDEFVAKCATDPRGLWPVAGPYDNEAISGHYTGHSFWALLGLKYAVVMAQAMGRQTDADRWQKIHDDYSANFLAELRTLSAASDGYIPPGMDRVTDGNDWDNASGGLYPFEALAKDDPLARRTLEIVRGYNYQEGIMTYGGNAWVAKQQKQEGKHQAPRHPAPLRDLLRHRGQHRPRRTAESHRGPVRDPRAHGQHEQRLRVRHSGLGHARPPIELHAARLVRRSVHRADSQSPRARGRHGGTPRFGAGPALGEARPAGQGHRGPDLLRFRQLHARQPPGRRDAVAGQPLEGQRRPDSRRVPPPVVHHGRVGDDRWRAGDDR